jgi:predicted metal-dependent hydrolase
MTSNDPDDTCNAPLPPQAVEGFHLFNAGKYFEAHEALEDAWKAEKGNVRELYRGILQIAVTYLHITRGNYMGAVKVYARSQKWLRDWAPTCRGIHVEELRADAANVMREVERLGKEHIHQFNTALLKPIRWEEIASEKKTYTCDRCGYEMYEKNCKVTCPNCGNRFDCSDLNIYFD